MADDEFRISIFYTYETSNGEHAYCDLIVRMKHADGSDAAHLFLDKPLPVECHSEIDPEDETVYARVCAVLMDLDAELRRLENDEYLFVVCGEETQSVLQRLSELDLVIASARKIASEQKNMRAPVGASRHVSFAFLYRN